jgi:alpha-maltose-1-phosphate synthase
MKFSAQGAPKPRVVQTVFGRFHHFDLARQLHRHGCLEAIFTAYPRWKLKQEKLPSQRVHTFPWLLTPLMAKWRMGWLNHRLDRELSWLIAETLDRYVARRTPACDVFVGISGSGLHTARRGRRALRV